ncbi:MAG: CBS domain-containing protein [Burkholderiaceae bacterium]
MSTVKKCLASKHARVVSVHSTDRVVVALSLMRDHRVRSVMVIDEQKLVGIITQGDCAIKVLLQGRSADAVAVREVMTPTPLTVSLDDSLERCMNVMASRNIRHLPVLQGDKVVGVVSIGDIVKDIIEQQGSQIKYLETYIKGHGAG